MSDLSIDNRSASRNAERAQRLQAETPTQASVQQTDRTTQALQNPDVAATVAQADVAGFDTRKEDAARATGLEAQKVATTPTLPAAEARPVGAVTDDILGRPTPATATDAVLKTPPGGARDAMIETVAARAGVEVPPNARVEDTKVQARANEIATSLREQAVNNPARLDKVPGTNTPLTDVEKDGLRNEATRTATADRIGQRTATDQAVSAAFGGEANRKQVEDHWAKATPAARRDTMNAANAEAAKRSAQAEAVLTTVVPFSDATIKVAQGDLEGAAKSAAVDVGLLAAGGAIGKFGGKVLGAVASKADEFATAAKSALGLGSPVVKQTADEAARLAARPLEANASAAAARHTERPFERDAIRAEVKGDIGVGGDVVSANAANAVGRVRAEDAVASLRASGMHDARVWEQQFSRGSNKMATDIDAMATFPDGRYGVLVGGNAKGMTGGAFDPAKMEHALDAVRQARDILTDPDTMRGFAGVKVMLPRDTDARVIDAFVKEVGARNVIPFLTR
jgi:hypothetical protein